MQEWLLWEKVLALSGVLLSAEVHVSEVQDELHADVPLSGQLENQLLMPSRVALSVPLVNAYNHPLVAGPVLASHPLDLQVFPDEPSSSNKSAAENYAFSYLAPVGPPAINVEAKLAGVDDDAVENGADPVGTLLLRGPTIGTPLELEEDEDSEKWTTTGERARVLPNGTFKVVSERK